MPLLPHQYPTAQLEHFQWRDSSELLVSRVSAGALPCCPGGWSVVSCPSASGTGTPWLTSPIMNHTTELFSGHSTGQMSGLPLDIHPKCPGITPEGQPSWALCNVRRTLGWLTALNCTLRAWWADVSSPVKDGGMFNLIFKTYLLFCLIIKLTNVGSKFF